MQVVLRYPDNPSNVTESVISYSSFLLNFNVKTPCKASLFRLWGKILLEAIATIMTLVERRSLSAVLVASRGQRRLIRRLHIFLRCLLEIPGHQ